MSMPEPSIYAVGARVRRLRGGQVGTIVDIDTGRGYIRRLLVEWHGGHRGGWIKPVWVAVVKGS